MWIRKTAAELAELQRRKHRRRFNPFYPLLVSLGMTVTAALYVHGGSVGLAVSVLTICFLMAYISQIVGGPFVTFVMAILEIPPFWEENVSICRECHAFQFRAKRCENCGGNLEHPDWWRWIPDEKTAVHR